MKYHPEVDESLPWPAQEAIRQRRWMAYRRQLERLKHRISGPAYRQLAFGILEKSLHDARLLSFQAGDAFGYVPDGTEEFFGRRKRGYVEIKLLGQDERVLHTFRYKGLKGVECRMSRRLVSRGIWLDDFGDLMADELTSVNESFLRHEYEFYSGVSITIEFEKLIYRRQHIRRRYP
jgi:hypothetical protein